MLDNLKKYRIILASASPRRRELMQGLDVEFEVRRLPDVDESFPLDLQGGDIPLYISKKKADAYRSLMAADELESLPTPLCGSTVLLLGSLPMKMMHVACCITCRARHIRCSPV